MSQSIKPENKMAIAVILPHLICVIFSLFIVNPASAEPPQDTKVRTLAMLRAAQYDQLDREMNAVQKSFERGKIDDEQLLAAFRVFYVTDRDLEPRFSGWIEKFPASYAARLARGIYYKYMGFENRGDAYISETTEAQIAGMRFQFEKSMRDLFESSKATEKPLLSYLHAIDIGKTYDQSDLNRRLLNLANEKVPKNFVVRRKYLYSLETRWNGSVQEMSDFVKECRNAGLSPHQLRTLEAIVTADAAWNLRMKHDYSGAQKLYEEALRVLPNDDDIQTNLSWVLIKQAKYSQAIPHLSALIEANPKNVYALASRGICYAHLSKNEEAFWDYKKAAELGDAISQNELGKFYFHGIIVPKDRAVAAQWFRRSAQQGNNAAKENLAALSPSH